MSCDCDPDYARNWLKGFSYAGFLVALFGAARVREIARPWMEVFEDSPPRFAYWRGLAAGLVSGGL